VTTSTRPPIARCNARLASGDILVPGVSPECSGPDAFGVCPHPSETRPCQGATWHYTGRAGWLFEFPGRSGVCPVSFLDPLGPLPIPGD